MNEQQMVDEGRALADAGKALAEQAEEAQGDFLETMRAAARRIAAARGFVSADDLREEAARAGLSPHHPNVWGSIFHRREWRVVGRKASRIRTNHSREIKVWALT